MELYNVVTDPSEEENVAGRYPERVSQLLQEMRSMMDENTLIRDPEL